MDVILAIPQPDLRLAIDLYLREEPGVNVVGVARELVGLIALLKTVRCHLLILDWDLLDGCWVDLMAKIRALDSPPLVVILGHDEQNGETVLIAGADFFMVKEGEPADLVKIIEEAHRLLHPAEDDEPV